MSDNTTGVLPYTINQKVEISNALKTFDMSGHMGNLSCSQLSLSFKIKCAWGWKKFRG